MAQAQQRNNNNDQRNNEGRAVATVEAFKPSRLPVAPRLLEQMQFTEGQWNTLCDQIFPGARTADAVFLAINYCRSRNLDIFKRPVNIVPMYSNVLKRMVETCWPSIVEIRTTATRTGSYAGISEPEFGPIVKRQFKQVFEADDRDPRSQGREVIHEMEYPEWCKLTVYRIVHGQRCGFNAIVFWKEAYATAGRNTEMPNEMWRKRTLGQLDKCTEAAALRKAFPEELGNTYAAEEMHGKVLFDDHMEVAPIPEPARPTRPPAPPAPPPDRVRTDMQAAPPPPREQTAGKNGNPPAPPADKIEDADYSEIHDGQTDTEFFEELAERMGEAHDAAEAETIWADMKPENRFAAEDALNLDIVAKIKRQAFKRWEKSNA